MKRIFAVILIFCLIIPFQSFASENEEDSSLVSFLIGDVNLDGVITPADARTALRASAKLILLYGQSLLAADFNEDGILTASDARYILRKSAGLDPYNVTYVPPATTIPSVETTTYPQIEETTVKEEPTTVKPAPVSKIISVEQICQYPSYPTGCESVAAVMNLKYYHINITVSEFIDKYLYIGTAPYKKNNVWYSSDPNTAFLGNPRSNSGWGIWAKGLERSLQRCLDVCSDKYSVESVFNKSLDSLCKEYIAYDVPVIVWVTANMKQPKVFISPYIIGTKEKFNWISPNHCMLLVGYDKTYYYFNDPITGKLEKYSRTASEKAFKGNGSQAVIIAEK